MNQNQNVVKIGTTEFGPRTFTVIAGPCSIESEQQFETISQAVTTLGAAALRGGIFKMRTSPDTFQGLGESALEFIKKVKDKVGKPLVSEVVDPRHIEALHPVVDMFQVGSRNMYNYALLKELGAQKHPVLLKRGFSATIEEWVMAAEYIIRGGNENVILCERGIRCFETKTRNTLDLGAVAWVKQNTNFNVIVDPSHAVGIPELIPKLALASAAVGADGLIVEVHHDPKNALSDGFQALTPVQFGDMMNKLQPIVELNGRRLNSIGNDDVRNNNRAKFSDDQPLGKSAENLFGTGREQSQIDL